MRFLLLPVLLSLGRLLGGELSIYDPEHPQRVAIRLSGGWTIEQVRYLATNADFGDPLSGALDQWQQRLSSPESDREILAEFGGDNLFVPERFRAAEAICLPASKGLLHPVGRAISKDGSKAIGLYWALAYKGGRVGFDQGVLIPFEVTRKGHTWECSFGSNDTYRSKVFSELLRCSRFWKARVKDRYLEMAENPPDPENQPFKPGKFVDFNDLAFDMSRLTTYAWASQPARAPTPRELLVKLEDGGMAAWLDVVDYWLSEKEGALREYRALGNERNVDHVRRTAASMRFDRLLYAKGMRPPDEFCDGVDPWWWEEATRKEWIEGEALEFVWQALEFEVFKPWLRWDRDTRPVLEKDLEAARRFLWCLQQQDQAAAEKEMAEGHQLERFFRPWNGTVSSGFSFPQPNMLELAPFGKRDSYVEVLARARFRIDARQYVLLVIQNVLGDLAKPPVAGRVSLLCLIEEEAGWRVCEGFGGSQGAEILEGGHSLEWGIDAERDYWFGSPSQPSPMPFPESPVFSEIWKPFLNPTLRR